jgi:asparagine synthase (glutamine-hydrolysing)
VLTLTEAQLQAREVSQPKPYWSLENVAETALENPVGVTADQAAERLQVLLLEAVRQQMVADVPLGAFLSGGIDSSLVVALMQAQSRRPIKTFSIGFQQAAFDEAPFARAVARHLGTDHTEYYVRPEELVELVPRLAEVYDEPFADPSQIPTLLLCKLARTQVTVSLSGDAGDELFGGYELYRKAQRLWPVFRRIPHRLRRGLALPPGLLAQWALSERVWKKPPALTRFLSRVGNLAQVLPAASDRMLYQVLMSPNRTPLAWLQQKAEPPTRFNGGSFWERLPHLLQRMMYLDFVSYLPDDILVKVDRAAMSVSLETRIPLLDHRVIAYAWSLPPALQQQPGRGKLMLRQVLDRYVPRALLERPKKGFNVPIAEWLRGPLRAWAEELLSPSRLRGEGLFDEPVVRQKWAEHLKGSRDHGAALWHVLMFQAWLERRPLTATRAATEPVPPIEAQSPKAAVCPA